MTDPDKPMKLTGVTSIKFNFDDFDQRMLGTALIRTIQHLSAHLDAANGGQDWRKAVYKEIFEDVTIHSQEGTGSKPEADLLRACGLVSDLLGVSN